MASLNNSLSDRRPCIQLRSQLQKCLLESDCLQLHKRSPQECFLVNDGTVSSECINLRKAFVECRQSTLEFQSHRKKLPCKESAVRS